MVKFFSIKRYKKQNYISIDKVTVFVSHFDSELQQKTTFIFFDIVIKVSI